MTSADRENKKFITLNVVGVFVVVATVPFEEQLFYCN